MDAKKILRIDWTRLIRPQINLKGLNTEARRRVRMAQVKAMQEIAQERLLAFASRHT